MLFQGLFIFFDDILVCLNSIPNSNWPDIWWAASLKVLLDNRFRKHPVEPVIQQSLVCIMFQFDHFYFITMSWTIIRKITDQCMDLEESTDALNFCLEITKCAHSNADNGTSNCVISKSSLLSVIADVRIFLSQYVCILLCLQWRTSQWCFCTRTLIENTGFDSLLWKFPCVYITD